MEVAGGHLETPGFQGRGSGLKTPLSGGRHVDHVTFKRVHSADHGGNAITGEGWGGYSPWTGALAWAPG